MNDFEKKCVFGRSPIQVPYAEVGKVSREVQSLRVVGREDELR